MMPVSGETFDVCVDCGQEKSPNPVDGTSFSAALKAMYSPAYVDKLAFGVPGLAEWLPKIDRSELELAAKTLTKNFPYGPVDIHSGPEPHSDAYEVLFSCGGHHSIARISNQVIVAKNSPAVVDEMQRAVDALEKHLDDRPAPDPIEMRVASYPRVNPRDVMARLRKGAAEQGVKITNKAAGQGGILAAMQKEMGDALAQAELDLARQCFTA
jgi:hypothetical protein